MALIEEAFDRSRVTPEGEELGRHLVKKTQPGLDRVMELDGVDGRCISCAYRLGTVPNGCPQTQLDALKATLEGVPFKCHHSPGLRRICAGWMASRIAIYLESGDLDLRMPCPWDFSEDLEESAEGEKPC